MRVSSVVGLLILCMTLVIVGCGGGDSADKIAADMDALKKEMDGLKADPISAMAKMAPLMERLAKITERISKLPPDQQKALLVKMGNIK